MTGVEYEWGYASYYTKDGRPDDSNWDPMTESEARSYIAGEQAYEDSRYGPGTPEADLHVTYKLRRRRKPIVPDWEELADDAQTL